ncbi:hypothetical protein, partial [Ferdinandcohnia sp. SAFN-114]|uniref:hypothetical protein n=1 Tax=Ferdinandcohnia sp. SAFN-114 TaxID=3387275 RepID=UPI003F7E2A85
QINEKVLNLIWIGVLYMSHLARSVQGVTFLPRLICSLASATRNSGNFNSSGKGKLRLVVAVSSFLISGQVASAFLF